MSLTIRHASAADIGTLYALTSALAIHERKTPSQILVTEEKIRRWGFGASKVFDAILALFDDEPCGMSVYFFTYAGSVGAPVLYIEDLFVLPEHRGRGIGTSMLSELSNIATSRSCCRMEWHVFSWNDTAMHFYSSLGAVIRDDLQQVRLEQEAFAVLSARRPARF